MALKLLGEVSLDGSGWEAGLRHVSRRTEEFAHSVKEVALEAFGVYGLTETIKKTVELGEDLVNTSRRLGISVEALQELRFAAKESGAELDVLTSFIEKLNAARINPKLDTNFARFGIKPSEISGPGALEVQELIKKIAVKVQESSPQAIVGDLRKIGGRGAGEMIPLLQENLEELGATARRLGAVIKTEDAVALKFLSDEMKALSQVMIAGFAPAVVIVMKAVLQFVNSIRSAGDFWGKFSTQASPAAKSLGQRFMTSLLGGERMDPGQTKEDFKQIGKAFSDSGAASETARLEANANTEKMFAEMLERQKVLENLGAHPEFPDETPEPKANHALRHGGESSDALIKVGNFLGASRDTLTGLAQRQVDLLQRIEHNTRGRSHSTHFEESIFPQR